MTAERRSRRLRRLRIAYVYDALYPYQMGGGERRFHELAVRLAEWHEVHYITWQFWNGLSDITDSSVQLHGVGTPRALYGEDRKRTVREALEFAVRVGPVLARYEFDVVDCAATPYLPLYAAWLGTAITGTPLVATWHEFWGDHWKSYLDHRPNVARIARWSEAGAVRLGRLQVAVSPFTADRLRAAGLPAQRVRVVGNGLPVETFARAPAAAAESDLVYVGRLIDDKRLDLMIDAVDRLRADFPDLRCVIVGDGPERAVLEARVHDLGLERHVWFMGILEEAEKVSLLKASKLLILPSEREGFGIAAIEGQAAGLVPLVAAGPHSAAATLVIDGVDGLVFDPNPDALAAAVRSLLRDSFRLALMRAAAIRSAQRWDWDRIALQMEDVYFEAARPQESAGARARRLSWS